MASVPNSIPLTGPVAPFDETDPYPTHFAQFGKGGYRSVADASERDAIPVSRREEGMLVYTVNDGAMYQLVSGSWVTASLGGGYTYSFENSNFTAQSGYIYGVDVTSATITATLPSTPQDSDQISFCDPLGSVGEYQIIIDGNGNNISGQTSISITRRYESVSLVFDGTNNVWVIWTTQPSAVQVEEVSDIRDKDDIEVLPTGLDFVNALNPVKFVWNMRDNTIVGISDASFIAQDLAEVQQNFNADYLNLVNDTNYNQLRARPHKLIPVLVKAIQELSQQLDDLR